MPSAFLEKATEFRRRLNGQAILLMNTLDPCSVDFKIILIIGLSKNLTVQKKTQFEGKRLKG